MAEVVDVKEENDTVDIKEEYGEEGDLLEIELGRGSHKTFTFEIYLLHKLSLPVEGGTFYNLLSVTRQCCEI